jgi:hypothetical protein
MTQHQIAGMAEQATHGVTFMVVINRAGVDEELGANRATTTLGQHQRVELSRSQAMTPKAPDLDVFRMGRLPRSRVLPSHLTVFGMGNAPFAHTLGLLLFGPHDLHQLASPL